MLSSRRLTGTVLFIAGAGCATAVVDEDPSPEGTVAGTPLGSGGTVVSGSGSAGTTGTGGSGAGTSVAGGSAQGGTSGMVSGVAGRSGLGAAGRSNGVGSGGMTAAAGRTAGATGGRTMMSNAGRGSVMMGGGAASAGGPGGVTTCPTPRAPAQPGATQGNSGSFDTTEAVCFFVQGSFNAWSCSNIGGRTVSVNGARSMCGGALPEKVDGGYYFEFGASTDGTNYTSFYWYTS